MIMPVLIFSIAQTCISLIYIYPINEYIYIPHYAFAFLIIFLGIYCLIVIMNSLSISKISLGNTVHHVIAKSMIIVFVIIIVAQDIHEHQKIIVPSVDMILSLSIFLVKTENSRCCTMHLPYRGLLLLMVLITINFCLIVMGSSEPLPSLFVFAMLSVCTISLIAKFLIRICNDKTNDYIKKNDELLYSSEKYNALIKIIKEHVKEYYNSPIDKYTIALQCEMHPDYISKVFKREEGITINKYIQIVRLEKAHHLLLHSDEKIIEVAFDVGYDNLATFYRHFVKQYKKSPQQIRKEKLNA